MDFTPGTLVSLKVKFSFGTPDYKAPSKNKTLIRLKYSQSLMSISLFWGGRIFNDRTTIFYNAASSVSLS
jgi:hypothetical protein